MSPDEGIVPIYKLKEQNGDQSLTFIRTALITQEMQRVVSITEMSPLDLTLYVSQAAVIAICCMTAQASQFYDGGGLQLVGVPDLDHYEKLEYPKYDIQELGSETHGHIPPKTIKVLKTISYKVPEPYPVKVPFKVPYPVTVEKPIPVVETKFIKVPHPIPIPVVKEVPVPHEVPKPYPVPAEEFKAPEQDAGHGWAGSFGGGFGGSSFGGSEQLQTTYGVPGQEPGTPLGESDYGSYGSSGYQGGGEDEHGEEDRSAGYAVTDNQGQEESGGEKQ